MTMVTMIGCYLGKSQLATTMVTMVSQQWLPW